MKIIKYALNKLKNVIITSQNLVNYKINLPNDAIFRINLAWCDTIIEFENILKKHKNNDFFVDLPIKRVKPPNNKYTIEDLIPIIKVHKHIRYFAISNVESSDDLKKYIEILPDHVTIVPKIESPQAIENIEDIVSVLLNEKILMLDHDDLFSSILKQNRPTSDFKKSIKNLVEFCEKNNVKLLRTIGVVFSDSEKRISNYIN
jgi:citrate lyase beta subunit